MTRLSDAGVVGLQWSEDEDGSVQAEGLQSYDIDTDNELAVFQGDRCIKVHQCVDFNHAVSMVEASEAVCRWRIKEGGDGHGRKVNERGWAIPRGKA